MFRTRSRTVRSLVSRESARLPSSGRGGHRTASVAIGRSNLRGAPHSSSLRDSHRGGRLTRPGQSRRQCALRSDRPKQDVREVILDGDCRTDRRYLEIRASSYAERAQLNWWSKAIVRLRASTITTPCDRAPRHYAEPKNFQIGIAPSWSWAIGSSTSAAQRPFDMVVCRRKASSLVLITGLGLRENGRPSLTGTALWTVSCSMG